MTSSSEAGMTKKVSWRAPMILADWPPETISFARGAPSADILPAEAVREAAARALESDWKRALSYGTGKGHPGLCEWIAELHGVDPDQVMVTNGSMEGAALLFRTYVGAGDRVIVEQPTYDRTLLLLKQAGAELVPAPLECRRRRRRARSRPRCADGAAEARPRDPQLPQPGRLHALDGEARAPGRAGRRARLHPVRGRPLPPDQLRRARPATTMLDMDDAGRVIHASSFSKTVSPGVRVGYLVGPAERDRRALQARPARTTSRRTCWPSRSSGSSAARARWRRTSRSVNAALRERRDALVEALEEKIPEAEFVVPGGGYFLWLDLDEDVDTAELLERAKEEGVTFVAGPDFMIEGGGNEPAPLVRAACRPTRSPRAWSGSPAPSRVRSQPGVSPMISRHPAVEAQVRQRAGAGRACGLLLALVGSERR